MEDLAELDEAALGNPPSVRRLGARVLRQIRADLEENYGPEGVIPEDKAQTLMVAVGGFLLV